jgi:hypothetical protein
MITNIRKVLTESYFESPLSGNANGRPFSGCQASACVKANECLRYVFYRTHPQWGFHAHRSCKDEAYRYFVEMIR